jgi:hypothetical protein
MRHGRSSPDQSQADLLPPATGRRPPSRRPLRVYAFDPQQANTLERVGPGVVTVEVAWERLDPGPSGARVQVIDFDGGRVIGGEPATCFYEPVDLDDPDIAVQKGLAPRESDPQFHQQMVYAIAKRTFESFDRALGRRIRPRRGILRLVPHAFRGENAFYDPDKVAVLFGYFRADPEQPGPNLPGQFVYTCLSQDIIAHEVTHALLDRIRPRFLEATNPDVAAFHEAIADLTAIFLHFTIPGVVADTVASTQTDLTDPSPLVELARQFGYTTGRQAALRSALDTPDPRRYQIEREPHARAAILVAAVFDAFLTVYRRRTADLIRLATGGTGQLPAGALHPDLVARVASEAERTARQVSTMTLRALDFLPPVDITFSDFLRAIVTADRDLYPTDGDGLRAALIDACRKRGIYPTGVQSLADASLAWPMADIAASFPLRPRMLAHDVLELDLTEAGQRWPDDELREQLCAFASELREALGFASGAPIDLDDAHSTFRYDEEGAPQVNFILQLTQRPAVEDLPGIEDHHLIDAGLRRGATVIADGSGNVQYVITKPLPGPGLRADHQAAAAERATELARWIDELEWRDPLRPYGIVPTGSTRLRLKFARLHADSQS